MLYSKFVINLEDGAKVWLNIQQLVKMIKTPDDRYLIYMSNGDVYAITYKEARTVENLLEGKD